MHICIIGSGVIGATSAYYLTSLGYRVTLLDAASQAASGASFANGGQLSYNYVAPLAGPDVLNDAIRWILWPDSPLRFRPRLQPSQWRWLFNFVRACTTARNRQTTMELLELAQISREALHALISEHPFDFHYQQNGKLIIHRQADAFNIAKEQVNYQRELGASQTVLNPDDCIGLEPELKKSHKSLLGGIYTAGEEVGDCRSFTSLLIQKMQENRAFTLCLNQIVRSLKVEKGRIVAACTEQREFQADHFVIAAGMESSKLTKSLGVKLPLYPLKGYSLSLPSEEAGLALSVSVTDYTRRIVYATLGSTFRVAGLVEIGSNNSIPNRQSIARLSRQCVEVFPQLKIKHAQPWAGLRPATAQGKPIIGRVEKYKNLWLNVGQGALGFTLACGSGRLLAAQLAGLTPPVDSRVFSHTNVR